MTDTFVKTDGTNVLKSLYHLEDLGSIQNKDAIHLV